MLISARAGLRRRSAEEDHMPRKVLIVDDNPFVAKLWNRKLTDAGYLVQIAVDGMTARRAVADWRPDLVLPDTDGLTLCREWRGGPLGASLRVIFVSALTSRQDMDAAYEAGADGYITKSPDTAAALAAKIGQLLAPLAAGMQPARGGVRHGA
jgi:DNA-binding response OmpR family regulator